MWTEGGSNLASRSANEVNDRLALVRTRPSQSCTNVIQRRSPCRAPEKTAETTSRPARSNVARIDQSIESGRVLTVLHVLLVLAFCALVRVSLLFSCFLFTFPFSYFFLYSSYSRFARFFFFLFFPSSPLAGSFVNSRISPYTTMSPTWATA